MAEKLQILELDLNADAMLQEIKLLKQRIEELKVAQKEAKESGGEMSDEYITISAELKGTQEQLRSTESAFKKLTIAHKDTIGTIMKLEAENAKLREEQKKLNLTTEEGRKRNEEINKKLNENNKIIFENSDKLKQNKMSVGGYVDAMKEMGLGLTSVTKNLGLAGTGIDSLNLKMLRFLANPIGLLIAAIALAFKGLVEILKTFQPVVDKVQQSAAAVSAAFTYLKDRIIALVTGAMSLKNFFSGLIGGMKEVANEAAKLKKIQQDIEDGWTAMSIKEKELQNQIDELTLKAKNRTLSEKERQKLLDEALKKEKELHDEKMSLAKLDYETEIQTIANKHKLNNDDLENLKKYGVEYLLELQDRVKGGKTITDKEVEEFKAKQEKLLDIQNEDIKIREKIQNKLDELADKAEEKEAKLREQKQKEAEELAKKEKERLEREAEEKRKAAEEAIKIMEYEYARWKELNKSRIIDGKYITEDILNEEKERLKQAQLQEEKIQWERFKKGLQSHEDYWKNIWQIRNNYEEQLKQWDITYAQQEYERQQIDLQNKLEALEQNSAAYYDAQKEWLERQRELELAAAEKTGADKEKIIKKYNQYELQLERQKTMVKLDLVSNFAQNVANLFGKATVAGKLAASAQTVVDTIKGAQSAYAAAQVIPPPAGQIIGAANAALVVAAGAKAVRDIWATKSGLPESGATAATNIPSQAVGGVSQTVNNEERINQNIAGTTGAGLITRGNSNVSLAEQLARINLQPVLVIDDVQAKQNELYKKSYTQVL